MRVKHILLKLGCHSNSHRCLGTLGAHNQIMYTMERGYEVSQLPSIIPLFQKSCNDQLAIDVMFLTNYHTVLF